MYHVLYHDTLVATSRLDTPNELMGVASGTIVPGPAWQRFEKLRRNDPLVMEELRIADESGRLLNAAALDFDTGEDGVTLITIIVNDAEYWHRVNMNKL
ncbi:MAG: hypothetical protein ACREON_12695 [Gemmatimonadaceae bacterium]